VTFRADIEGLRAVAVLAVVLYHCGVTAVGGGYIGVDVFFVLAEFLITSLMLSEIESTSRLSFRNFYGRRARRLLPAATMVIAATVFTGWFVLSPLARRDLIGDALSATTYTVNWRLASHGTDYFQSELAPSALQHYWSLAVEEQFYVAWPLIIWLLAGPRLRRGRRCAGLGLVVVASFAVCLVVTEERQPWAFFGLHTRMWQLGAGSLLAAAWPTVARLPHAMRRAASLAGLAGVVGSAMLFDDATAWPGAAALVPTLGATAVLVGVQSGPVTSVLAWRPLGWIGARSYSWYLWHWPALILFAEWRDVELTVPVAAAVALGALLVSHVGYTLVEQPIRHERRLVRSARTSIAVGLGLSTACLAALLVIRPTAERVDATGTDASTESLPDDVGLTTTLEVAAGVLDVPANLRPSLADARDDFPEVYALGCHADVPVVEPTTCELGDPSGSVTVVLMGDSHAAQWTPALDDLAADSGIRLVSLTKSGCPAFDVPVFNESLNRVYDECDVWRRNAVNEIATINPDVVITTQSWLYTPADAPAANAGAVILDGYVSILRELSVLTDSLVVLGDTPYPLGDVPDCVSAHLTDVSSCTAGRDEASARRRSEIEELAAAETGAAYVAVDDLVCGAARCPVVVGDLLVYRDNSHLSTPYVRWVAPHLAGLLGGPWVDPETDG